MLDQSKMNDSILKLKRPIFYLYVNSLHNMVPTNEVIEFYFEYYFEDEYFRAEEKVNNSDEKFFVEYYIKNIFKYRLDPEFLKDKLSNGLESKTTIKSSPTSKLYKHHRIKAINKIFKITQLK